MADILFLFVISINRHDVTLLFQVKNSALAASIHLLEQGYLTLDNAGFPVDTECCCRLLNTSAYQSRVRLGFKSYSDTEYCERATPI